MLRERGLRATVARLQLLSMLEQTGDARMTAEQIFMKVAANGDAVSKGKGKGAGLSMASVYRVLKELANCGLVERGWCHDGQEVRLLFSRGRTDGVLAQPRLLCVSCHRSMVLEMPQLREELNRMTQPLRLQPQERSIVVHVTCPDCA